MNKSKARKGLGKTFTLEGKEGAWIMRWNSKQVNDAGTWSEKPREVGGKVTYEPGLGTAGWLGYQARSF